nr:ribonuclease H-like domain-containing protein [Tanacetum cinerariifolium]
MKRINREYSNARTLQQNRVAERKNMTLIKAARTMLADSLLSVTLWAEAVNTTCYVFNRALVTKTHNKTAYELLNGRSPRLDFMRPFGCPVTIFNTLNPLGKFEAKADEGFLVGYFVTRKEVSDQHCIVFPLWSSISSTFKSSDDQPTDDKPKDDTGSKTIEVLINKKDQAYRDKLDRLISQEKEARNAADALRKEFEQGCMDQRGVTQASSTNSFNTVSNPVNAASTSGTFSAGGASSPHPDAFIPANTILHVDQDDSQIPDLEETVKLQSIGIFNSAHNDDLDIYTSSVQSVGAKAEFNNMESSTIVSSIPTRKIEPKKVSQALDDESWVKTMQKELLGTINKTLFLKKDKDDIMLMQVYVDDIIFGSTKKSLCDEFEALMHKRFQMSSMGELTFFLGLQVTPKLSHLQAVKRIFRYLKGQPKLGLWYPRDSPINLEAYSDSDYARANLDRKSITEVAQTRFETASKRSSDPPLLIGHTVRSGEDRIEQETDLTNFIPTTPHNLPLSGGRKDYTRQGDYHIEFESQDAREEKKRKARTLQPMKRRLFKGRVKTSTDKSLGKDASKQGRNNHQTKELNLTNGADTEVIIEDKGSGEKYGNTTDQVSTVRLEVSAATPSTPATTTIFGNEDLTIAQTVIKMRSKKAKEKGVAFREDLAVGTPSSKINAKAEAFKKQKAFTFGLSSCYVAKRTRSALAQSSGSTTLPSMFVGDDDESDDDDDSCVEIPLVTPLHSADVIPSSEDQDSWGKGVMVDDAATPSAGLLPVFAGPYYVTYPEDGITRNFQGLGEGEEEKIKSLTKILDNLDSKVARLSAALNQATILEAAKDEEILRVKGELLSLQNKKWVSAMVDAPDAELTDDVDHSKNGGVFMHGTSHVLDDVAGVTMVGSKRVSFDLTDVVVALFATDEEATASPSGV